MLMMRSYDVPDEQLTMMPWFFFLLPSELFECARCSAEPKK
jgi:hypothetical protein